MKKTIILFCVLVSLIAVLSAFSSAEFVCTDSDGGINYAAYGCVNSTYAFRCDSCMDSQTLIEFSCLADNMTAQNYNCQYGCNGGACRQNQSCIPATCASLGYQCGGALNGCGGIMNCGTCESTFFCNSSHLCQKNQTCIPATCSSIGYQCGTASDGCGATLNCGGCSSGYFCNSTHKCQQNQTNQKGNLYVVSTPPGANLYVDNILKGTTPTTVLGLPVGNHVVLLKKSGYSDVMTTKYIYPGQTGILFFHLTPIQNQTGNLYVSSTPTRAFLYVDYMYKGTTPITVKGLTVGNHVVKVMMPGYKDYSTTKYLYAGQTANIGVNLTRV